MQTRQNLDRELPFNWQTAKETVDAFAHSCRVPCLLTSAKGEILYQQDLGQDLCKLCQATMKQGQHCEKVHLYGSYQAERFGGRELFCVGRRHGYQKKTRDELWAGHDCDFPF